MRNIEPKIAFDWELSLVEEIREELKHEKEEEEKNKDTDETTRNT